MDQLEQLDVVRAVTPTLSVEMRADGDGMPTMAGHFSVFDTWYEINSFFEGRFLERTAKGAFAKTIRESRDQMKVLYDHGMDFNIGNKVLGPIDDLREDSTGPYYEVDLLDTSYVRDLLPGLEAGLYGSSFRFRVIKDEWDDEPGRSKHNPEGLPERTIKETRVFEFGPVTFPANPDATAGVRSMTDEFYDRLRTRNPEQYDELVARARQLRTPDGEPPDGTRGDGAADPDPTEPPHGTPRTQAQRRQALRRKRLAQKGLALAFEE